MFFALILYGFCTIHVSCRYPCVFYICILFSTGYMADTVGRFWIQQNTFEYIKDTLRIHCILITIWIHLEYMLDTLRIRKQDLGEQIQSGYTQDASSPQDTRIQKRGPMSDSSRSALAALGTRGLCERVLLWRVGMRDESRRAIGAPLFPLMLHIISSCPHSTRTVLPQNELYVILDL